MVLSPDSSATAKAQPAPIAELLLALLLMVVPVVVNAQSTYYVNKSSPSCSDAPTSGSQSTPFCTIQYAVENKAGPNVTIVVEAASSPYAERVRIRSADDSGGLSGQPFILRAAGATVIDGAQLYSTWTARPVAVDSPNKVWKTYAPLEGSQQITQVHLNDVRYADGIFSTLADIPIGFCDWLADTVFVNFPAGSYETASVYVSKRVPLFIDDDWVTIEDFTVLRSADNGIDLNGPNSPNPRLSNCIVRRCTVKYSASAGIALADAANSTVSDNSVSHNTTRGIQIGTLTDHCSILRNTVFSNAHPVDPAIKVQGIRIGNGGAAATGNHLVEANRAHSNADTGIEVNASHSNTLRYNQSYLNKDHGFDHIAAQGTIHTGDLAYANDHDGFSVEAGATNTSIYNCIMADNGRDPARKDWELEVFTAAQATFVSHNNVYYRAARTECQPDDTVINWGGGCQQQTDCNAQCVDSNKYCPTVEAFHAAHSSYESNSKTGNPAFVDPNNGGFQLLSGSAAIDGADSAVPGWIASDVRGFVRHDYAGLGNSGNGTPSYADIGPYEFDGAPGAPVITVCFKQYGAEVNWTARGDDADVGTPSLFQVLANGQVMANGAPAAPGSPEFVLVGLQTCTPYSIKVRMTEVDNAQTAESITVTGSSDCAPSPPCGTEFGGGGGEMRAGTPREANDDFPLMLAAAHPEAGMIRWSIPRGLAGSDFDLSIFDVAGRRVTTIAAGMATPGNFSQALESATSPALAKGVYFARLTIGLQVLTGTVIVVR